MSAALLSGIKKRKVNFVKGDVVKVIEGDLKHLMGTVHSVDENMITIMPNHQDLKVPTFPLLFTEYLAHPLLKELLTFREDQLAKHFKMGDHVKVISGMYEGETGLILRVDNNVVTLFSDLTKKEVKHDDTN